MPLSEAFLYESDEESNAEEMNEYEKELDLYLKANFSSTESTDLLKFWLNFSNVYPNIAKMAKKVLAIPATQFESERNFSASGRTLESRRNRLSPENVDHLLFLRKNLKI
jgi:hypothetical protein